MSSQTIDFRSLSGLESLIPSPPLPEDLSCIDVDISDVPPPYLLYSS